ncbi:hypothetical protein CCAN2_1560007 [Capnocytophaga canimorsus]|nr:hypothetical protein CCAN2_1560007 [Capnocytophaga canimorsus]
MLHLQKSQNYKNIFILINLNFALMPPSNYTSSNQFVLMLEYVIKKQKV